MSENGTDKQDSPAEAEASAVDVLVSEETRFILQGFRADIDCWEDIFGETFGDPLKTWARFDVYKSTAQAKWSDFRVIAQTITKAIISR